MGAQSAVGLFCLIVVFVHQARTAPSSDKPFIMSLSADELTALKAAFQVYRKSIVEMNEQLAYAFVLQWYCQVAKKRQARVKFVRGMLRPGISRAPARMSPDAWKSENVSGCPDTAT